MDKTFMYATAEKMFTMKLKMAASLLKGQALKDFEERARIEYAESLNEIMAK